MPAVKKPGTKPAEPDEKSEDVVDDTSAEDRGADEAPTEATEETTETTEETTEKTAEKTTEEDASSAADLQAALDENARLKAENDQLKAGARPAAPAATDGQEKFPVTRHFISQVLPAAKQRFTHPEATAQDQFEVVTDLTDKLLGAYHNDRVLPALDQIVMQNIILQNEVEIRDLRAADPKFRSALESAVRSELKTMRWEDRIKPEAVQTIVDRLTGAARRVPAAAPSGVKRPGAASAVLRDVSAGGVGTRTPVSGTKLTPDQESDYQAMLAEGSEWTREQYYAKTKARQEMAKKNNRTVPKTYRDYT